MSQESIASFEVSFLHDEMPEASPSAVKLPAQRTGEGFFLGM